MKRVLLIVLALICFSVAASAADYLSLTDKANKAAAKGDYEVAEEYLLEALRLEPANPTNVLLISNLGMVRFYAGKDSLAIATLSSAHAMTPASVTVLQNRARVYMSTGRLDNALADFNKILELDSLVVEPRFYRSMIALNQGDTLTAASDLKILGNIAPDDKLTRIAFASFFHHTGQFRLAIPFYTKLLEYDKEAEYYAARALCFIMTDQLGDAADDIASAIDIQPDDPELYLYRAMLNKKRYRFDDAYTDAQKAIDLGADPQRIKAIIN